MTRRIEIASEIALYFGKTKIVLMEGQLRGDEVRLLHFNALPMPAGFDQGLVKSLGDASQSLLQALTPLMTGQNKEGLAAWIGVGQSNQRWFTYESSQYYGAESRTIQPSHIRAVVRQTMSVATLPLEQFILASIPESFWVDDVSGVKNPVGLEARRLGVKLKLFTMPYADQKNILRVLDAADVDAEGFIPKALALSESMLQEDEKMKGCILADLCADRSMLIFWKDGLLREVREIPWGADAITREIAQSFNLDFHDAQKLKHTYGSMLSSGHPADELIPLVERDGKTLKQIKRYEFDDTFSKVAQVWLDGLVREMKTFAAEVGAAHPNYVFTGGGAALEGFLDSLAKYEDIALRLGQIHHVETEQKWLVDPSLSSALSMFRWIVKMKQEQAVQAPPEGSLRGWLVRCRDWFSRYF